MFNEKYYNDSSASLIDIDEGETVTPAPLQDDPDAMLRLVILMSLGSDCPQIPS